MTRKLASCALALVAFGMCMPLLAQEAVLTPDEMSGFAAREAAAPDLALFSGGDAAGVLLFILLVALIVYCVVTLMDHRYH